MTRAYDPAELDEWVSRAREGDRRAFDRLVRTFRPRIYALALHLTGSPTDADDVTQEAFLKAYRRIGSFEGRSAFFTWLYRIAVNRSLNHNRDGKKRRHVPLSDPRITASLEADGAAGAGKRIELQEAYAQLLAAFDQLSDTLRITVVLTTLQGLSHAETAVVLDTTEGTVAWRVHEARRKLREKLTALEDAHTPTKHKLKALDFAKSRDHIGALNLAMRQLAPEIANDGGAATASGDTAKAVTTAKTRTRRRSGYRRRDGARGTRSGTED